MPNTILIGAQWGDEGKGKIIDVLAERADWIVRFQGGNNAGHTVIVGGEKYVLHLLPSGMLSPGKKCVIGHGVVVDLPALRQEVEELAQRGISAQGRLFISDRAHLVCAYHRALDAALENARRAQGALGTTRRGIGPCYADKAARIGLRVGDTVRPDFADQLRQRVAQKNSLLRALGGETVDAEPMVAEYLAAAQALREYIADTARLLHAAARAGAAILCEGAQGTMLDIDYGTYPFVTSSSTTAGGACTGAGLPPGRIDEVVGVVKAYTTRVGEGPFPTELQDEVGRRLQAAGHEFGATTGRPRRCGWFDAVVARYTAAVNGVDHWAITKLDVLDGLPTLNICTAYELRGQRLDWPPASADDLAACVPVYEECPGWPAPARGAQRFADLPAQAQAYVRRLETLTGVKAGILSVGPDRNETFFL